MLNLTVIVIQDVYPGKFTPKSLLKLLKCIAIMSSCDDYLDRLQRVYHKASIVDVEATRAALEGG